MSKEMPQRQPNGTEFTRRRVNQRARQEPIRLTNETGDNGNLDQAVGYNELIARAVLCFQPCSPWMIRFLLLLKALGPQITITKVTATTARTKLYVSARTDRASSSPKAFPTK